MTDHPLCEAYHRRRPKPPARFAVTYKRIKDDRPPMLYCGVHARSFRNASTFGSGDVWLVEPL